MKNLKKIDFKSMVKTVAFANMCTLAIAVCNVAIGRCIPGYLHEPEMSLELLSEEE